jgi:multiple sugar transport system substrate-binding protein
MKKLLIAFVLTLLAFSAGTVLAGGQQGAAEEKTEISVLFYGGYNFEDLMEDYGPKFEAETGIKLNSYFVPYAQLREKLTLTFASETGEYDIVNSGTGWEGVFHQYFAPLQSFIDRDNYDMSDYIPVMRESNGITFSETGERYGIPQRTNTMVQYYNTKIFNELGLSDPAGWEGLPGWDELFAACEKIRKDKPELPYPFVTAGVNPQLVKFWSATYLPQGRLMFTDEGEPVFNNKEGLTSLEYVKRIFSYGPPNAAALERLESGQIFLIGDAAIHINWPAFVAPGLEDPDKSRIMGNWAACAPPGPGNIGSQGIYMTKTCENKEAAWEFLKWFTSKEMTKQVMLYGGAFQARMSVVNDPEVRKAIVDIEAQYEAIKRSFMQGLVFFPNGGAWFHDAAGHLGEFLAGNESAQQCLDSIEESWYKRSGEDIGKYRWLTYFEQQGIEPRK